MPRERTDSILAVKDATGQREVALSSYLDAAREEQAAVASLAWIKSLRHARVDGQPFRRRFTYRDDSLWWFAEIYLHKQQVILNLFRTILALEALVTRERPLELQLVSGGHLVRGLAPQIAERHQVRSRGFRGFGRTVPLRLAAMETRAASLHARALASRLRPRAAASPRQAPAVAAFVHRAFWRADTGDGSAETYIGPVLAALEDRLPASDVAYVSVGPSTNFGARKWWHPLGSNRTPAVPIEAYAPLGRLEASRRLWRERHQMRRALWNSDDIRRLSVIRGCDCWPVVREELAGIALLQWPWSARAMDEAGCRTRRAPAPGARLRMRRPAAGAARSCSRAAAEAFRRWACSTASSIVTGSITCTSRMR